MIEQIGVNDRPVDAVMPALAQDIVTLTTGVLVVLLLAYSVRRAMADRDPQWPVLVVASGITIFMEPFACFMVAHHPAIGAYVLITGLGVTVPVQLLFFYMLYFAPTGLYLIHRARQRVSAGAYWRDFAAIYLLLFGGEAVAIALGVWFFFGNNPFVVLGLPLWVALTNIAAVYAWAVAADYTSMVSVPMISDANARVSASCSGDSPPAVPRSGPATARPPWPPPSLEAASAVLRRRYAPRDHDPPWPTPDGRPMTARPRSDFSGLTLPEILAHERLSRDEASRRAALVVADRSTDVAECRELLAMLGLTGTAEHTGTGPSDSR